MIERLNRCHDLRQQSLARGRGRRQAFTLIEMIATLSILLLLAVAASTMLGSVTEIGLGHRNSLQQRGTVLRLAETLRGDVSNSVDVVSQGEEWPLQLIGPDHHIEYRWNPQSRRLLRVVRAGSDGEGAADQVLSTDVYSLGERVDPRLVVTEDQVSVVLKEATGAPAWIVEARR